LKVHFHHFLKIKSQKESQNRRNQGFSYYFCMMFEGSGSGSGSIPLTSGYGSGSGRPKKMWIRWIRIRIRIRNTGFLCTGGVSYAPFKSLLISNLFCTKGEGGEGGRESLPPLHSNLFCTKGRGRGRVDGEPYSPPSLPCREEVNSLSPFGRGWP
jgi:hypothetical protein